MALHCLYVLLAAFVITRKASAESISDSCEACARKLGQPVDGWKIIHNTGDSPSCIRQPVDLRCNGEQFYDPETRIAQCCHPSGNLAWVDKEAKLGYCCAAGHEWTGDLPTGEGGCCPFGYRMVDGQCQFSALAPKEEEKSGHSCGCHSASSSESLPLEDETANAPTVGVPLSIQYGRCYSLSVGGTQIGSTRENTIYRIGGLFQEIPFRVCKSTTDCAVGDTVPYKGSFFLQDQIGRYNDPDGKMGWVAASEKGPRIKFTLNRHEATEYQGAMKCMEPGCPIRLSGVPQELHFTKVVCETDLPLIETAGNSGMFSIPEEVPHHSCH